ncbi:MAG: hypothetical protein GY913_30850 [Proteobacteria bacterium]|nr:hypothetical protein [Pseudomonadota bacterium]MCP4921316.1 hypothetical protein [Pseudomonadota bacterium]
MGGQEFTVPAVDNGRVAASQHTETIDGRECTVFTVFLGLDHKWFAATAPAPTKNDVTVLVNGEEAWKSVYDDVTDARDRITWSTWFWHSDFELRRPSGHSGMGESERWKYTSMAILEDKPNVDKKILINRFWGDNSDFADWLNTDGDLRYWADKANDNFEVVVQGNDTEAPLHGAYEDRAPDYSYQDRVKALYPERQWVLGDGGGQARDYTLDAASYHQKAIVVDGEVAFVGGMNTKSTDWDTNDHLVFDERRMAFDASESERDDVYWREELPDLGPRRDYMMRAEGPVAHDVEAFLKERWDLSFDDGSLYAENATSLKLDDPMQDVAGGSLAQVTVSLPNPIANMSIWETHAKAFAQAKDYIFIEDQYFRAPLLNETIAARMLEEPDLVLIVVTKPVSEWDPGLKYTYLTDKYFEELFGDRYLVMQLRTADMVAEEDWYYDNTYWYDTAIDTHSKLRIVDDEYVSIGSCNYNNRGYLYEGEMNLSVLDETIGKNTRAKVFQQLVGPELSPYLSADAQNNMDVLRTAMEYNAELFEWWEMYGEDLDWDEAEAYWDDAPPAGFVHPVEFSGDYIEVGPDLF